MKEFADSILKTLDGSQAVVVTAPPGAGKSTVLPLHFLKAEGLLHMEAASARAERPESVKASADVRESCSSGNWKLPEGRILMLEPRRLAARQIAERTAYLLGEPVGKSVGYRVRFESRVSKETRLEILTEGILTRMLVEDPTLDGVSMVIFDEFHERSLQSDLALALTRESQRLVRPDLKIVIMSATIDTESVCKALDAPLLNFEGQKFPVDIVHVDELPEQSGVAETAEAVAHVVSRAAREHEGDILAFLPGEAEIRRCAELLSAALRTDPTSGFQRTDPTSGFQRTGLAASGTPDGNGSRTPQTRICPLYGMLPFEEQHRAIAPSAPGERKIVLSTPIAETSLTIEGVRVVVDSGLYRKMVFDPQSALSRLETRRVSLDMATQRSGRAGRVAAGTCYRMWSLATEARMAACRTPEIRDADLARTVLDISVWGENDPLKLPWLELPPMGHVVRASRLLQLLGAIDPEGRATGHGRALDAVPCHPRIANMLLSAKSMGLERLAADVAAVIEEKDPMPDAGADLVLRVAELRRAHGGRSWSRIEHVAGQYRRLLRTGRADVSEEYGPDLAPDPYSIGMLVGAAFPERIGKAHRDGCGKFLLSCGELASLGAEDSLAACEWIAAASVKSREGGVGRIFLAAPLDPYGLIPGASGSGSAAAASSARAVDSRGRGVSATTSIVRVRDRVCWDSRKGCIVAQHEWNIGCLTIDSRPIHGECHEEIVGAICDAAARDGRAMLDFSDQVQNLQRRVAAVSAWHPELDLPDLSTDAVLSRAHEWLPAFIGKATTVSELKKTDLCAALWSLLDYSQQQAVDRLAPTHIEVPTGSRIRVEYRLGAEAPVLRVRLQECFGLMDTPRVDEGRKPVLMELLSPGFKPVQLTGDLRSFWDGTYFEVRKELRRRYPKHSWPDNPQEATAVRGIKKH